MAVAAGLALALGAGGTAEAAPRTTRVGSGEYLMAIVFEHDYFRGAYLELWAELCSPSTHLQYFRLPPSWNDKASSIRVRRGCDVYAFEHSDMNGGRLHVGSDQAYLGVWNDRISSFTVQYP
ncbi:hypothetical protein [Streptomyces clavuligerus]|uniref:Beta and gamma crystallin n=1 Tax=Streptomyces clavuligerus TaxID=1901 RepID=E2PZX4_STRCL|nr:hypothetical protein [Streptomyces clavuligerus]ANW18903.1 hypothetical protein BB341_12005 [Streptomyces clavuligerus]AXU13479.1 hypothetical protein D1794_12435 [Streptomyces clavuligerus]EFG08393.1 Beta and gamma crystallin [Streptomyces clavuligerus]MBY6303437.1 hypothetical protein [Streptomyces clavuligerus]QCS06262.1 hypothetical protein CRV15_11870 [Streptomyces clavuligerus]